MVNEFNKPPPQENLALGERLLSSQRQLQEMQEEHRQLLQEMEVLRQRAAALSRFNEQQFSHEGNHRRNTGNSSDTNENSSNHETAGATEPTILESVDQETSVATEQTINSNANNAPTPNLASSTPNPTVNDEEDEDPETAEYLQQKLAEIAKLKARFKQVQNIMNTTDMIEEHIASKSVPNNNTIALASALESSLGKLNISAGTEVQSPCVTSTTTTQPNITLPHEGNVDIKIDQTKQENTITDNEQILMNNYSPSQTPNEELLSTMMNMFSDFTADLRSQADDLRAERDRLRALKEDLLRRKRQS